MTSLVDQASANVRRRRRRRLVRWLERHPSARLAAQGGQWAWRRRGAVATGAKWAGNGFRPLEADRIRCAQCGKSIPLDQAEAHLNRHLAHQGAARRTRPTTAHTQKPNPTPPRTRRTRPQRVPEQPSERTTTMATLPTTTLVRVANAIGEMDPTNAWELDAQLAGLSAGCLALAENVSAWIERLDAIRTDPRVTGAASDTTSQLAETAVTFARTRKRFRSLYAAQFEAAETGVRQIRRDGFWDTRNA